MSDAIIPGLKLIHHTGGTNIPDDPSLPWKLEVNLRPPDFMNVAFIMLHGGSEEVIVRGESREALEKFVEANEFKRHPRLREIKITGPNGESEIFPDRSA